MLTPHLNDSLNWLKKLTFLRLKNVCAITISYYVSLWLKKPIIWGKPISISIEPTTSCNLRCPECPSGLRSFTRPTGMLDETLFKNTVDQSYKWASYLLLYFQGEPYLHPQFTELVKYASNKGLYTATSTNAHYLSDENSKKTIESGLDRLVISIDGTTQETYESYRVGGNLHKVIEGTKNIVKWKKKLKSKTPYILFQFLVVKPNEHQIEEVKALGKELGVDKVAFKTAQLYEYKNGNPLMPTIEKYSRYKQLPNGSYVFKNKLKNQCWKMWHSTVVTWDGSIVPCCFDKDAEHQQGSLKESSLDDIWSNQKYQLFRTQLLTNRKGINICQNCTEGTKVWR
ncbi:MAG: SPASM domain-containing protein [Cyclobacteriaceae bacterium]|nr:SPASM domain-containing protein [Cyclobacteriaceae bacterium]